MLKHCGGSSRTMRWLKSNIAMVKIKHCDGSNRASQCFFYRFIICQKNGLACYRVTFLVNFWCITEILCNFAA